MSITHLLIEWLNHLFAPKDPLESTGLTLGQIVVDGQATDRWLHIPTNLAECSMFIMGVPGVGKTRLLKSVVKWAISEQIGLQILIAHPDFLPFALGSIAEAERRRGVDLSPRCPTINMADRRYATPWNLLEVADEHDLFIIAAEISEFLRVRYGLESLGVRILELLRHAIFTLAATGHTLVEIRLFLHNAHFRRELLQRIRNTEVRAYFEEHYDRLSSAEQATYSAAVLNKLSEFIADPLIAHCLGQPRSAVNLTRALDEQMWMTFVADKAVLREQSALLLGLYFIALKNAIFPRRRIGLSLIIADEVQNLLVYDSGLEILLSEGRKTHTALIGATQSFQQLTPATIAAFMGTGTQIFFRLSPPDAERTATLLGGGKQLANRLKQLPQRHAIVRTGEGRLFEIVVPQVDEPRLDTTDLYRRIMQRWAKPRNEIEREINSRHAQHQRTTANSLQDWE